MNQAAKILVSGILISLILGLGIYLVYMLLLKTIPYEKQKVNTLGMLIVHEEASETQTKGISVYRFEDKKQQHIPGSWAYEFILPHNLFVFGYDPARPGKQIIFTLDDRKAGLMDVSALQGIITNVKSSSNRDYLTISGTNEKDKTYYSCVILKKSKNYKNCQYILGDIIKKDNYSEVATYVSLWNPARDAELIIAEDGDKNRVFLYHAMENRTEEVQDEAKKQEYTDIISKNAFGITPRQEIKKYGPLVFVKIPSTNKYYFFLHFSKADYIPASDVHLLYKQENKIWLVDLQKKQKSEFITLPENTGEIHTFASQVR